MQINIYNDAQELIAAHAEYVVAIAQKAIAAHNRFDLVLSGGSSPQGLYKLLVSDSYRNRIAWDKTYFFYGDERFVPEDDEQRNSLMAQRAMLDELGIPESHHFRIDATVPPEEAARHYGEEIKSHFGNGPIRFDLILLGLGDDAHTASLFPGTSVLKATDAAIKAVFPKNIGMHRITMTAPLLNQAKHVAFLVFGKNKAEAVSHVLEGVVDIDSYPAQLIEPKNGELQWFLDKASASLLKKSY